MMEQEINLYCEYLNFYVQILPYVFEMGGKRMRLSQVPTFEEYKKDRQIYQTPQFKEPIDVRGHRVAKVYVHGLGYDWQTAYRHYNYFMGCKYYPNNIAGNFTIDQDKLQRQFKAL